MRYGYRWMDTWPHISLGISAHVWPPKFAHLSLHLPFGVLILGYRGADEAPAWGGHAVGDDNCNSFTAGPDGIHCARCRYPAIGHVNGEAATIAYLEHRRRCVACDTVVPGPAQADPGYVVKEGGPVPKVVRDEQEAWARRRTK